MTSQHSENQEFFEIPKMAFEPKCSWKMDYPEKFIRNVRECFSNDQVLFERINEGDCHIGLLLFNGIHEITDKEILMANSLQELKERATKIAKQKKTYMEWLELCREQNIH